MTGVEIYNAAVMSALAVMLALTLALAAGAFCKWLRARLGEPDACMVIVLGLIASLWAGVKPPVVVERGIDLADVAETSTNVTFRWTAESTNIVVGTSVFRIEAKMVDAPSQWFVLGTTTATNYVHEGFTVGQSFRYRISVDKGVGE